MILQEEESMLASFNLAGVDAIGDYASSRNECKEHDAEAITNNQRQKSGGPF